MNNNITVLFVTLIIILAIKPTFVIKIYNTILGRLCLIGLIILMSIENTTLGLLISLVVIAGLNKSPFVEGFGTTIGDDTATTGDQKQIVLTNSEKEKIEASKDTGVDKEAIKNAITPKNSKTIQLDPNMMKNEDVSAFDPNTITKESFATY